MDGADMAEYALLNITFMALVMGLLRIRPGRPSRARLVTLGVLCALTAVFDSLLVVYEVIDYTPSKILGIRIGAAPIEDFCYAVLAVMIIPRLWAIMGSSKTHA